MSKNLTRGIDNKNGFLDKLKDSSILVEVRKDPDLLLCIRNNYVNIYYKGASLAKIEYVYKKLRFSIANKYLDPKKSSGYDNSYSEKCLIESINKIKEGIRKFQENGKKFEKMAQQELILKNNNQKSNWFCVDMEYVMQRSNKYEPNFGRFDIVAISKEKPHRIALIELKYGCKSYGGDYKQLKDAQNNNKVILETDDNFGCGILGHTCDYIRYIKSGNIAVLKDEIIEICKNYSKIKMIPENPNPKYVKDFPDNPEVYFITVGEDVETARTQMKKYLFTEEVDYKPSIYNVEAVLGLDITKQDCRFNPKFLFSEEELENLNIDDIIDYGKYYYGLENLNRIKKQS